MPPDPPRSPDPTETPCWSGPARRATSELRIKGSRFLGDLAPVESEEEARAHLKRLRDEHRRATHHCWAYRIHGTLATAVRSSDDGEPGGTAGVPILRALEAADLIGASLVVVRWFGGTKLGVGPLARAYRETAAEAVAGAGVLTRRRVELHRARFPYADSGAVRQALKLLGAASQEGASGQLAELIIRTPSGVAGTIPRLLADATGGRAVVEALGSESEVVT